MVVVTDSAVKMTSERLRESAFKLFRKMEWGEPAVEPKDVEEG